MSVILSVANQKGGVGKTTTSVNTSAVLSKLGKKVLLIDLDPQANATMGSGVEKQNINFSIYQVLIGKVKITEPIRLTDAGYDILPANQELAGAELDLVDLERREFRLADSLECIIPDYEYILIDCPPSLSLLTLNGLCASNGVLIPMQCEYYALEGLSDLINSVKRVYKNLNSNLSSIGLLRVMFDPRITLAQEVSEQLNNHFGEKVFKTLIPRNIRLAEAPSYGLPILLYDRKSKGSLAYESFGKELIEKINMTDFGKKKK